MSCLDSGLVSECQKVQARAFPVQILSGLSTRPTPWFHSLRAVHGHVTGPLNMAADIISKGDPRQAAWRVQLQVVPLREGGSWPCCLQGDDTSPPVLLPGKRQLSTGVGPQGLVQVAAVRELVFFWSNPAFLPEALSNPTYPSQG